MRSSSTNSTTLLLTLSLLTPRPAHGGYRYAHGLKQFLHYVVVGMQTNSSIMLRSLMKIMSWEDTMRFKALDKEQVWNGPVVIQQFVIKRWLFEQRRNDCFLKKSNRICVTFIWESTFLTTKVFTANERHQSCSNWISLSRTAYLCTTTFLGRRSVSDHLNFLSKYASKRLARWTCAAVTETNFLCAVMGSR